MKRVLNIILLLLSTSSMALAQTYCISYEVVNTGSNFVIDVSLQGTSAFDLGTSTLVFTYNGASLTNPVLVTDNLATSTKYNPTTVVRTTPGVDGRASINIFLKTVNDGSAIAITPANTKICRISFTNSGVGTSNLNFDGLSEVFKSNNMTLLAQSSSCPGLNVVLPIEIISFDATKGKTNTLLTWKTANALQMSHFDVERSKDGKTFASIGSPVKAVNTIDKMAYNLTDEKPFDGINYYRLKSVETSGKAVYSKVVSVLFGTDFTAKAFPNPFHDVLTLDVKSDRIGSDMTFELIDVLGQQVAVQKRKVASGNLSVTFNTLNLTAGSYIVRIKDADNVWQEKFVKY